MHDYGKVIAIRARKGDVVGRPVNQFILVDACRSCGMRPDGSEQIRGVGVFRTTACPDGKRHEKV